MKPIIRRIVSIALGIVLIIGILLGLAASLIGMESYCWWNPWIDTYCAPGFTEKAFNSITNGMTKAQIIILLGEPFGKIPADGYPYYKKDTVESWYYTGDGKCDWSDWAWLGRYVCYDENGNVTETSKVVHND